MTACTRCSTPLTTNDLRWYFDGRAEAAMGVRSTFEGFESMLIAGPPTGYRDGSGAERQVARSIDSGATARHRCIREHQLGHVAPHHVEVLRVAYCGEDWTRMLDEHVGRGPRVELQRLFPHEQLQVALLTPTVQRALEKPETPVESAPIYASMESTLTSLRRILQLKATATMVHARAKLSRLASWAKGKAVRFDAGPMMEALRILVNRPSASTRAEKLSVLSAARRLLTQSERFEKGPVRYVAKTTKERPPPSTPQSYLVSLLTKRGRKTLARVREEADQMLLAARREARVTDPAGPPRGRRAAFHSPGPTHSLHKTLASRPLHG